MTEHEVVVHRSCNNASNFLGTKFDKSVMFRGTAFLIAGKAKACNISKLGKVGFHLVFVETVGNAAESGVSKKSIQNNEVGTYPT